MNTQQFIQTGQIIELCCEYLSVRYIWLYVIVMSSKLSRMNLHSMVAWMSRNSLLETSISQQRVPWHSGNYRVYIYSEASTWHDITYRVIHRTNDCPKRSSIIWLIWLNGWVFACRVSGCGFKSAYCYLNFRYRVCFEQGVHLHSDNYRF